MHPIHYQYLHTAAADGALEPGEYTTRHQDLGMTSWYTVRAVRQTKPRAEDARTEVRRISGLISFEPDQVEVHLDGTLLCLEPGRTVIPHGPDRDLTAGEVAPATQP
jgi:uncharacterized protein (DUF427 family)